MFGAMRGHPSPVLLDLELEVVLGGKSAAHNEGSARRRLGQEVRALQNAPNRCRSV